MKSHLKSSVWTLLFPRTHERGKGPAHRGSSGHIWNSTLKCTIQEQTKFFECTIQEQTKFFGFGVCGMNEFETYETFGEGGKFVPVSACCVSRTHTHTHTHIQTCTFSFQINSIWNCHAPPVSNRQPEEIVHQNCIKLSDALLNYAQLASHARKSAQ